MFVSVQDKMWYLCKQKYFCFTHAIVGLLHCAFSAPFSCSELLSAKIFKVLPLGGALVELVSVAPWHRFDIIGGFLRCVQAGILKNSMLIFQTISVRCCFHFSTLQQVTLWSAQFCKHMEENIISAFASSSIL